MHLRRIVAAFVALILAAAMSQALLAPAEAAGKPKHELTASGKEIANSNKFIAYGKVTTFPSGKIKVLRSVSGGPYKTYKKIKTKANGKFKTGIAQSGRKKTCFKVEVPSTSVYKKTQARIGCIVAY